MGESQQYWCMYNRESSGGQDALMLYKVKRNAGVYMLGRRER
jgi:hypothetical protein